MPETVRSTTKAQRPARASQFFFYLGAGWHLSMQTRRARLLGKTSTLQQMPFGDLANLPTCHQVHSQHDAAGLHKCSGVCTSSLRSLIADAGAARDEQSFHEPQQMMAQAAVGRAVQQRCHVGCVVKGACDVHACLGAMLSSASLELKTTAGRGRSHHGRADLGTIEDCVRKGGRQRSTYL